MLLQELISHHNVGISNKALLFSHLVYEVAGLLVKADRLQAEVARSHFEPDLALELEPFED